MKADPTHQTFHLCTLSNPNRSDLRAAFLTGFTLLSFFFAGGCATTPPAQLIEPGTRAYSAQGLYSVDIQSPGWYSQTTAEEANASSIRPPPPDAEIPPSLSLYSAESNSWVIGRNIVRTGAQLEIDNMVATRRAEFFQNGATDYREYRRFIGDANQITASFSRYVVGREIVIVLTAIREPVVVELIAGTLRGAGTERKLIELLESLEIPTQDGGINE